MLFHRPFSFQVRVFPQVDSLLALRFLKSPDLKFSTAIGPAEASQIACPLCAPRLRLVLVSGPDPGLSLCYTALPVI